MYWFKRDWWKASIATASMLLLLILIVWVPVSAAGAYEGASGSAMPRTIMVQVTPTEDAVVTALNREKLKGEIVQQQHTWDNWLWNFGATILSTLAVALAGFLGFLRYLRDQRIEREKRREDRQTEQEKRDQEQQRWLKDQEAEREKRAEERFQVTVAGLGDTKEGARIGAAILLRTFLRPGYKQFYIQTFDLAVANLCPTETPIPPEGSKTPLPLTTLRQALIVIFKEAFPLAQSQNKGSPQSLDASFILLDSAYLRKANLNQVWMPEVSLRHADLSDANLSQAMLKQANLSGADLRGANLRGANLREANLHGADLRRAVLDQADLRGADLKETDLSNAECNGANLTGADLTNANLTEINAVGAILARASLSEASLLRAKLMKANLTEARLIKADLTEAKLMEANLSGAYLIEAHLTETDFTQANLANADLSQSNPEDAASLKSSQMLFVKGLTPDQLKDYAYHKTEWSIFDDIVASPDRPSSLSERPQPQNEATLFFPPTSTQEGHPAPSSSQSNDEQAPSAPSTSNTDGSSTVSS